MDLSVIIVNYNVRAFLENALVSVRKAMEGLEGEIIVVDNASEDGSVEMIQQKFPEVQLIVNQRNLGFAAANNLAMRSSRGRYLLLLNPDTVVQEDTFRVMLAFMEAHPQAGLAGCKILNPDGSLQLPCRRSFPTPWVAFTKIVGLSTLLPKSRLFARYNLTYLDPDHSYPVDAVSGSFMFVRREVYETVGALDEQFFMYGEDLDWCYRIAGAGWTNYYVHSTQIIHYKGQSVRRSDIDEVRVFYEAMRVFVRKHFRTSLLFELTLRMGIAVREWIAFLAKVAKPLRAAALDLVLINCSLLLGEVIWFGEIFRFPSYAYPVTMIVPWLIIATVMYYSGVYTTRKLSITRAAMSVLIGYVIISALTFFFKQYGFSRMVIAISALINILALPGWRLVARAMSRNPEHRGKSLFGRRTIIVGTGSTGQEVLRRLRARIDDGYDVVGFVSTHRKNVGEKIAGVEILGSIDNIGKVIQEQRASEVIFSTDTLAYTDILAAISRSPNKSVNFRLVPSSLEVIIGRTHIDHLDDIPLVEIEYSIDRPINRGIKRLFDVVVAVLLMILIYPVVRLQNRAAKLNSRFGRKMLLLPRVVSGEMSLVGPPEFSLNAITNGSMASSLYWGKPGLTGLVQINYRDDLTQEEIVKYNLYYAKNQSLLLDLEILLKSFSLLMKS